MASPKVKLTFKDGSTEVVTLTPIVLMRTERHFGGNIPGIEGSFWSAWNVLGRPGEGFDKWVATIADFSEGGEDPDPTEPEASDAT